MMKRQLVKIQKFPRFYINNDMQNSFRFISIPGSSGKCLILARLIVSNIENDK